MQGPPGWNPCLIYLGPDIMQILINIWWINCISYVSLLLESDAFLSLESGVGEGKTNGFVNSIVTHEFKTITLDIFMRNS